MAKQSEVPFTPTSSRVLVEPLPEADKTPGGILIADTAKEKPSRGVVVRVGPGEFTSSGTFVKVRLEVGQTVLYRRHAGTEVEVEQKKYLVLDETDVLGVLS